MAENVDYGETNFPKDVLKRTAVAFPKSLDSQMDGSLILNLFSAAHRVPQWGSAYRTRDRFLREFWPLEPFLSGAIFSTSIRNANYEWEITGPDDAVIARLTDMLNGSITNTNFGWLEFIKAITQDLLTQDNGMFFEIVRDPTLDVASRFKGAAAPVIGMVHLESNRCIRTGKFETPVVYIDRDEKRHAMQWYEIVGLSQFPSTIQSMNGVGFSAVSRILKFAQIIEAIQNYLDEKISGRHIKQVHFVGGVSRMEIDDIQKKHEEEADNMGLRNYIQPLIYASLDPEKPVTTASIDLASIPDNFDFEELMRWYVANIALNLGGDYQDFAPLPSGNIGSANQSEILARKSQGKGPANWMETVENLFRDYAIIPRPYKFKFEVKDLAAEAEKADMTKTLVEAVSILRRADVINGKSVREWLRMLDIIPEEVISLTPDDFGNEETLGNTENLLGQVGDSTIGEDSARTKNFVQKLLGR